MRRERPPASATLEEAVDKLTSEVARLTRDVGRVIRWLKERGVEEEKWLDVEPLPHVPDHLLPTADRKAREADRARAKTTPAEDIAVARREVEGAERALASLEAALKGIADNVVSREEMRRHFRSDPPRRR